MPLVVNQVTTFRSTHPSSSDLCLQAYLVHLRQGSAARDYCMLERNLLAHLKLAILLCLLFASILLRGRLPLPDHQAGEKPADVPHAGLSVAALQMASALLLLAGGVYEYHTGIRDLHIGRAFLTSDRYVSLLVLSECR